MRLNELLKKLNSRLPWLPFGDGQNAKLIRRSSEAMILRASRTGISFLFNVILARMLGADGVGIYVLAYTFTRIGSTIARFGLDNSLLKITAAKGATQEWTLVLGAYRKALLIVVSISLAATAVLLICAPWIALDIYHEPTLLAPLRWMSLSILPWTILWLHSYLLQGMQRIREAIILQGVAIPLFNIPLLIPFVSRLGITGAGISYFLSTFIVMILGFVFWRRATPHLRQMRGSYPGRQLLELSFPLYLMDLTLVLTGLTDVMILGLYVDAAGVGIYGVVKKIITLTFIITSGISVVVSPMFAALYAKNEYSELNRLVQKTAWLTTIFAIPVIALFLLYPELPLALFGADFSLGAPALQIMSLGGLVVSVTGAVGFLLIMTGQEKLARNNVIITSIVVLLLQFLLIPPFGVIGAAIAWSIGTIARNLIAVFLAYRTLGILSLPVLSLLRPRLRT